MVVIDNAGWLSETEPGLLVPRLSACALEAGSGAEAKGGGVPTGMFGDGRGCRQT